MAQKKKKTNKKFAGIVVGIGIAVVAVIAIIISISVSNSKPKEVKLTASQSVSVSMVIVAIAMDKLDGSGSTTTSSCETFRALAKAYDENTDWFKSSYCSYIIYADYNETANTTTVTLSDGTYAAIYTFNPSRDQLLNYEFTNSATKGRGIIIEN